MDKDDLKCECSMPHTNNPIWGGPGFSRRRFFHVGGLGLAGYTFSRVLRPLDVLAQSSLSPRGTARYCIFVLLQGAPSHVDTFDLKEGPWTPANFEPATYGGVRFPRGLMPNIAERLDQLTIIRSVRAWALVHNLAQIWTQIARNPTAALGKISPNMGAVVALEAQAQRRLQDILPGFVALNANPVGAGYFSSEYAPFRVSPNPEGLANTTTPDGEARFDARWQLLQSMDTWRQQSPVGRSPEDMTGFYEAAKGLTYNEEVDTIFSFTTEERARYGSSGFGDACLVARNLVKADLGTRFIQINHGGWDHHASIYDANLGIYPRAGQLDRGFAPLLDDLAATPSTTPGKTLLDDTLIVLMGEFGRTVGEVNNQQGRDHYLQQFVTLAGGGMAGGRVIGSTTSTGAASEDFGWSQNRDIKPEDIACTIYSALGIDWTTIRYDDPFKRGFEYIPYAKDGLYVPVEEAFR